MLQLNGCVCGQMLWQAWAIDLNSILQSKGLEVCEGHARDQSWLCPKMHNTDANDYSGKQMPLTLQIC